MEYTGVNGQSSYTLAASGVASVAFSNDASRLFVARRDGKLDVYDTATHTLLSSWNVGTSLGGISLSADGSFLLATEQQSPNGQAVLYRIATSNGAVNSYSIAASDNFHDVEIVDGRTALVSGVARTGLPLRLASFDLATGTFSDVTDQPVFTNNIGVLTEDDHLTLLGQQANAELGWGTLSLYDDRSGTIVANNLATGGELGMIAVSEKARLVLNAGSDSIVEIYDLALNFKSSLAIPGAIDGVAFDKSGDHFFLYDIAEGKVYRYATSTLTLVEAFDVAGAEWDNQIGYGDQIKVSDDNRFISVLDHVDGGALQLIDLSVRNETFAGTAGADSFSGLDGNDTYIVNHIGDMVFELESQGTDTIRTGFTSYTLPANVEQLVFTGTGPVTFTGNDGNNRIDSSAGGIAADTINGGAGADTMIGGAGNDTYFVDDADDVVVERAGEGNADRVLASTSYVLGDNIELLELVGLDPINATGNAIANTLLGNNAANVLDGGAGADVMTGLDGDDVYIVDNVGDIVVEAPGQGNDMIQAAVSWTLAANFEQLVLTGTAAINGTGNDVGQAIVGNDGANQLSGLGGADDMYGAAGNDLLDGGAGSDVLNGGAGNDVLVGGADDDQFVFSITAAMQGSNLQQIGFGSDTVSDFGGGDKIVLNGVSLTSFQELQQHFTQSGADTVISFPMIRSSAGSPTTNTIKLSNVQASALTASQFIFTTTDRFVGPGNSVLVSNFAVGAGGWSSQDLYPRHIADVNGDGYADIVGFGEAGVLVSLGATDGSFGDAGLVVGNFGQATGWSSDNAFHRELADVNGDGRADIIGFGKAGTWVSLAQADGTFKDPAMSVANFGADQGWINQDGFTRTVGDVNGDGKADLVGFGQAGTLVALGNGDGTFKSAALSVANFGAAQGWSSDNDYHRAIADVNGDGKDDIIGFGKAGVWVSLSHGDGNFDSARLALGNFGKDQSWLTQDWYTRVVGDVNGDGRADILGFGASTSWIAFGQADGGFTTAIDDVANFSRGQGWSSDASYHRELADINHDGHLDIVGFGYSGVLVGLNQGDYFFA